jgi:cytochrome c oxidase assembly factor CtaG
VGRVASLLGTWDFDPVPWLGIMALGAAYLLAARAVSRRTPTQPWPWPMTVCWTGGIVTLLVAIVGPPGAWDDVYFFAHMTQHILLMSVAAPLLVLGDPLLLLFRVASPSWRRRRLVPAVRSNPVRVLAHPVTGWVVFVGVMGVTHIPAVYDFALQHPLVHDYVEHPVYVTAGMLYFYPLLVSTAGLQIRHWVRIVSLFSVMLPMAFLGFFIFALPRLAYPFYAHTDRPFPPGPLADQRAAGIVMWSVSMVIGVGWVVLAGRNWLVAEERRTAREESRTRLETGAAA